MWTSFWEAPICWLTSTPVFRESRSGTASLRRTLFSRPPRGIDAGKAAGMPVAAVTTTRKRADLTKADIIVDSLAELAADDFVRMLANHDR